MTSIVVARRDGIIRDPESGAQYRTHRGRTLADARHPVVLAHPTEWLPMEVHLSVDGGPAPETADDRAAILEDQVGELVAERDELAGILTAVQQTLARGGLLDGVDTSEPGWLVRTIAEALEVESDVEEPDTGAERVASTDDVRAWARENGFTVSDRGRIPQKVVEAYEAAHGGS